MRTFMLIDDNEETLTSGFLPKPITSCFGEIDEYQFENKEYLISIEKESLNSSVIDNSTSLHKANGNESIKVSETKTVAQLQTRSCSTLRKPRAQLLQTSKHTDSDENNSFIMPSSTSVSSDFSSLLNNSIYHPVDLILTENNNETKELEDEELITPRCAKLTKNSDLLNLLTPRCSDPSIHREDVSSLLNLLKTPANQIPFHFPSKKHQPIQISNEQG